MNTITLHVTLIAKTKYVTLHEYAVSVKEIDSNFHVLLCIWYCVLGLIFYTSGKKEELLSFPLMGFSFHNNRNNRVLFKLQVKIAFFNHWKLNTIIEVSLPFINLFCIIRCTMFNDNSIQSPTSEQCNFDSRYFQEYSIISVYQEMKNISLES